MPAVTAGDQRPAAGGDEEALGGIAAHHVAGIFDHLGQGEAGHLFFGLDLQQGVDVVVLALVLDADGIGAGQDLLYFVGAAFFRFFGLEDPLRHGFADQDHGVGQRLFAVIAVDEAVQYAQVILGAQCQGQDAD